MANIQWVLVANSSEAKLFSGQFLGSDLQEIQSFSHPESRNKGSDLVTDKMGSFQGNNGTAHGAYVETTEPKEVEASRFAHELAQMLEDGRTTNKFKELIIMASPQFLGLIKNACNDALQKCVLHFVDKDYTKIQIPDLIGKLEALDRY